jgi:hypothetical protein
MTQGTKSMLLFQHWFYEEADQGCRRCKDVVQDFELPVHEGFQVGDAKKSYQRLSSDSPRHRCGYEDFRQEHCRLEGQDHPEQGDFGGQELCESSLGVDEAPYRGISDD